jgi:polyphosphate kinase 2 (PPK2 family)
VHPEILQAQAIPAELMAGKDFWEKRYTSITNLERHLHRNGTRVIKFFLHLSKEEQRRRFLKRIEDPKRNWKFSAADIQERGFWKQYMKAYEDCLEATSTRHSPWFVVPADDKLNARLIISRIVLETLKDLKMSFPKSDEKRTKELQTLRKRLAK